MTAIIVKRQRYVRKSCNQNWIKEIAPLHDHGIMTIRLKRKAHRTVVIRAPDRTGTRARTAPRTRVDLRAYPGQARNHVSGVTTRRASHRRSYRAIRTRLLVKRAEVDAAMAPSGQTKENKVLQTKVTFNSAMLKFLTARGEPLMHSVHDKAGPTGHDVDGLDALKALCARNGCGRYRIISLDHQDDLGLTRLRLEIDAAVRKILETIFLRTK